MRITIRSLRLNFIFVVLLMIAILFTGCDSTSNSGGGSSNGSTPTGDPRDSTPAVLPTEAPGSVAFGNDLTTIDASNSAKGYVMMQYRGSNPKVKFQITTPAQEKYTYLVPATQEFIVYPLTSGNGTYSFTLYEATSVEEDLYAVAFSQTLDVALENEFLPFLTPNHYVDFAPESLAVAEGVTLATGSYSDLDVINNVYNYITENITYDTAKAATVAYGYVPIVDEALQTKTGICFDYAALMASMLRSQKIPTKMEFGYAGEAYHAWISCYVDEVGWVDDIIEFNGTEWELLDPTFAASSSSDQMSEYIGDGSNYLVQFTY